MKKLNVPGTDKGLSKRVLAMTLAIMLSAGLASCYRTREQESPPLINEGNAPSAAQSAGQSAGQNESADDNPGASGGNGGAGGAGAAGEAGLYITTEPPEIYVKQDWEIAAETEARGRERSTVSIDLSDTTYTITDRMFGVGYDGWGDIINQSALTYLKEAGVRDVRVVTQFSLICGDVPGEYNMEYMKPYGQDQGLGYISRLKKIIEEGWQPIVAFSQGNICMPVFFHGELNDSANGGGKGWWHYDSDGTRRDGNGDQLLAMQGIARDIAANLKEAGLGGLYYETIYEADGIEHNLPDIHYYTAKGIREGDPDAKIIGPATWPGYSVEEKFLHPYFKKYQAQGAELLDYVSVHWYAGNSFWWREEMQTGLMTMATPQLLKIAMETAPMYARTVRSARAVLDQYLNDPEINPSGKKIGVAYTEYDVNPYSPFLANAPNTNYPDYSAESDPYVNTNFFGGVWLASVMTDTFTNSPIDIMMKFLTRHYYGIINNIGGSTDDFYRQPVWYAIKLLRDGAGMREGAVMVGASVAGPMDDAVADLPDFKENSPWIQAAAVKNGRQTSIIIINRSASALPVDLDIAGAGDVKMIRYVYCEGTNARFIGGSMGPGYSEGDFEGLDDPEKYTCLRAINYVGLTGGKLRGYAAPGYSFTVFTF